MEPEDTPASTKKCKICGETKILGCFNRMGYWQSKRTGAIRERWRPECRDCTSRVTQPYKPVVRSMKAGADKVALHILKTRTCNRMRLELGRMNTAECRSLLGCTWSHLADHLMRRLYEGEDVRSFELDHIQPLKNFDVKADKGARDHLFNWRNLQLLTKVEHAAKTARERAIRPPTVVQAPVIEATWVPPTYLLVPTPPQPYPLGRQGDLRGWIH